MTEDLASLADLIAARIQVPIEHRLWDAAEVADYLRVSKWTFQAEYAPHPKFPRPVRVPGVKNNRMQPRWMARDVIEYMDVCKDR